MVFLLVRGLYREEGVRDDGAITGLAGSQNRRPPSSHRYTWVLKATVRLFSLSPNFIS